MAQAPTPSKPQPRKAADNPLAASLLAAVLMKQGAEHGDRSQMEQGRELLKLADAAKGKMPTIPHDSKMAKAIMELAKTGVVK